MLRQLRLLFVACLATGTTAFQAVAHNIEIHDTVRRTVLHRGERAAFAAEVGGLGEVALGANTDSTTEAVYGNLVLLTVNPGVFIKNTQMQITAQNAIAQVAVIDSGMVSVSLSSLEHVGAAVLVDFQASFARPTPRQAFIKSVVTDAGEQLVKRICAAIRLQGRQCELPWSTDTGSVANIHLHLDSSRSSVDTATALSPPPRGCSSASGNLILNPSEPAAQAVRNRHWQEAVALAISEAGSVSRLQVGTLMTVAAADAVQVDFWLTVCLASPKAVVQSVKDSKWLIDWLAAEWVKEWNWINHNFQEIPPVTGRLMLQVPSPTTFAKDTSVVQAVEAAVRQVAASPGPQASNLSVAGVRVLLGTQAGVPDAVVVDFQVRFNTVRDKQVFSWDFARDGGRKLAKAINASVPGSCKNLCWLPGRPPWGLEAIKISSTGLLTKPYGAANVWVSWTLSFASDPAMQEVLARAISQMAGVPQQQVGILSTPTDWVKTAVHYWVSSNNPAVREDAVSRVTQTPSERFAQCLLASLDAVNRNVYGFMAWDPENLVFGTFVLMVQDAHAFVGNDAVRTALAKAIEQVTTVPGGKVPWVRVRPAVARDGQETIVVVNFDSNVGSQQRSQAARAISADWGQKLTAVINDLVPAQFKGQCRLSIPKDLMGQARKPLPLRSGTMLIYTFFPDVVAVAESAHEVFAKTIAEVAGVPRRKVGILVTMRSPALLSIDFWILPTINVPAEVAVTTVNTKFNSTHGSRMTYMVNTALLVRGGTLVNGVDRYKC